MDKWTRIKFYISLLVAVAVVWLAAPTYWSLSHPEKEEAEMPKGLPHTAMKLGLDLQGGIHMVMGVDLDKVVRDQLASYGRTLEKEASKENIADLKTTVPAGKFELEVTSPSKEHKERVAEIVQKSFNGVLEFVGDTNELLILKMSAAFESDVRTRALEQSISTIRNRIDEFGVAEPIITRKGDSQMLVQFPGAKEPERLKNLIGQTAQLAFQMVHECRDQGCLAKQQADLSQKIKDAETKGNYNRTTFKRLSEYRARINEDLKAGLPPETEVSFERERDVNVNDASTLRPYLLSTKHKLSGEYIENAYVTLQQKDRFSVGPERPVVAFQMNAVGGPLFGALTTEFHKAYMAIVLDGIVKSAPQINEPITRGEGIITIGSGSLEDMNREARDLSIVLRAGALPASIEVQEERTIGPSLGKDAIESGRLALSLTFVIVFAFMWAYYGMAGLIANFVMATNIVLIVAALGSVGATLTLPGIAGIVLTIGMAVDALIIIFERMREEIRAKRSSKQVIAMGFDKAFATILDSNVTTALGAVVLLQYGTGPIRGFALTLLIGIVSNVFMATFFARSLFDYWGARNTGPLGVGLSKKELAEVHA